MGRPQTEDTKQKIAETQKLRHRARAEAAVEKALTQKFAKGAGIKGAVNLRRSGTMTSIQYTASRQEREAASREAVNKLALKDFKRRRGLLGVEDE